MAHLDHTARIGFVGAGAVGGSLAVALSKQGYRVVAVASRSRSSAESLAARLPGSLPARPDRRSPTTPTLSS